MRQRQSNKQWQWRGSHTARGQSNKDIPNLTAELLSLTHTHTPPVISIVYWNLRKLNQTGKLAQTFQELHLY